jgi:hypothetical protein
MTHSANLRRPWRAPHEDQTCLIEPPLATVAELLSDNRRRFDQAASLDFGGYRLEDLRREARAEALRLAHEHTRNYCDVRQDVNGSAACFVSGHQPQLFHPGVWFKNFVLDDLRRRHDGVSIHLLIDNDVCHGPAIRVPVGPTGAPHVQAVPFDQPSAAIPYEERALIDRELFQSFGRRSADAIQDLVARPIVESAWESVVAEARQTRNLGHLLSIVRHRIEVAWGRRNLELPLSLLCETRPFSVFVCSLLLRHEEFHEVHNERLREYRASRRIRSRSHPVPELAVIDGWHEVPFWIWTKVDPVRRPMFVRASGEAVCITDRTTAWRIACEGRPESQIDAVRSLSQAGVRIRPRALATTMFVRLFLADVFLHGIGGAKYDELTDAIVCGLWGCHPPAYLTVTATLRLPVDRPVDRAPSLSEIRQRIRQLRFHPERFWTPDTSIEIDQVSSWIEAKRQAIHADPSTCDRARRHEHIVQANLHLCEFVEEKRRRLVESLAAATARARAETILNSREYSFCLFPAPLLRSTMDRHLSQGTEQEN